MSKSINHLVARHRQNAQEHSCQVTNEDYLKVEPEIKLLERLSDIENCTYTVFDLHKNIYLLKSSRFKRMLGYNDPNELGGDDFEVFHSMIHPVDLNFVLETENEAHEFYRNLPASEKKEFKLIYDFRVKNKAGIYMRFIHQFVVLKQDIAGKSWLALIVTELLSERAADEKPQRRMINMKTRKLHLFTHDDGFNSGNLLTKREREILRLISQGLDSEEISSRLFISVNTVNNHRQKILSKTRTANTTQALLYARRIGIL
ncbi:MAG TPA: LuxR C-terminal-related transcriptional regulator [Bacteroidales bacterium]|nr:LuxR C-terminal-related transcriptional regulator [Bacteroidales bacterium]